MFGLKRIFNKTPSLARMHSMRRFSTHVSLFRPVATVLHIPADEIMHNLHTTHEITAQNEAKFDEYNKMAIEEYDTMIQNQLDAILGRGGISDWELAEDNGFLRKTFNFSTPDNAHYFVNQVSTVCSKTDHHPEWKMIGNTTIEVYLTSHFAGNKVSIKDYELAEQMNKIEKSAKSYNQYTKLTIGRGIEFIIFLLALGIYYKAMTYDVKGADVRDGGSMPSKFKGVDSTLSADQQLDAFSLDYIKEKILLEND